MKKITLCKFLQLSLSAIVGLALLTGCNNDDDNVNTPTRRGVTIIKENYGSVTRSGMSPIIYQESIDLGNGSFIDVTIEEDFASDGIGDVETRANVSEGNYTILGYYKDGRFAGANIGSVSFNKEGVGEFISNDEFKFHSGLYDFICVKNVDLSTAYDALFVTRGKSKSTDGGAGAALVSGAVEGTIVDQDIDIQFTMKHKESAIRFKLFTPGEFDNVKATISVPTAKASKHKYGLPSLSLDIDKTVSAAVDDIHLVINGGEQYTPYEYFLPSTNATDMTITFKAGGKVWGKTLTADQAIPLKDLPVLEANTRYTATINFRDGLPAFEGVIAIGSDGKLTLDGHLDPGARSVFFKGGSVVANGSKKDGWDINQLVFNPSDATTATGINSWSTVPFENGNINSNIDDAYHIKTNIDLGKGDPCRLVGLSVDDVKNNVKIDNNIWRLPTKDEYEILDKIDEWEVADDEVNAKQSGNGVRNYPGRSITINGQKVYQPALGQRETNGKIESIDKSMRYWTSTNTAGGGSSTAKFAAFRDDNGTNIQTSGEGGEYGRTVRCVPKVAITKVPAFDHIIAIGKDGKLTVTAETDNDTEASTVYFKFGSTIAQSSKSVAWSANEVVFNVSDNRDSQHYADWSNILTQSTDIVHTLDEVKAGKGDPCRLVGLTRADIENDKFDNKKWRMPTYAEHTTAATSNTAFITHGTSAYKGKNITLKSDLVESTVFYPAAGYRNAVDYNVSYTEVVGDFWSRTSYNTTNGYYLRINDNPINKNGNQAINIGLPVRCVPQVVPGTGPAGIVPAFDGIIAMGSDGKLTVTAETTSDHNARTVYFKFGRVEAYAPVKIQYPHYVGDGVIQAYNPMNTTIAWSDVPIAGGVVIDKAYHDANISAGKGDPCRLVGLSEEQIAEGTIDNLEWRLPTASENESIVEGATSVHTNGYPGIMLTITVDDVAYTLFYPLVGEIWGSSMQPDILKTNAHYWSNSHNQANDARSLKLNKSADIIDVVKNQEMGQDNGFAIRSVRQRPVTR